MMHKDIRIYGKVQGVGFRMFVRKKAKELNIKGFVRNEKDGSVFIAAEGNKELLEKFINWCKNGPALADVHSVKVKDSAVKNYKSFKIKHK